MTLIVILFSFFWHFVDMGIIRQGNFLNLWQSNQILKWHWRPKFIARDSTFKFKKQIIEILTLLKIVLLKIITKLIILIKIDNIELLYTNRFIFSFRIKTSLYFWASSDTRTFGIPSDLLYWHFNGLWRHNKAESHLSQTFSNEAFIFSIDINDKNIRNNFQCAIKKNK
jgi:hypothetical protein